MGHGPHAVPGRLILTGMSILVCWTAGCGNGAAGLGRAAGEEPGGAWWMQPTALTRDGKLDLKAKDWWPHAAALKVGEQFMLAGPDGAADRMLIRRETLKRGKRQFEAIVWVIDDDADGSLAAGGDKDSDCYIADWNADGVVDRMVDYIDNDGDHDPDEMDIRYFVGGELRQVWCGMDLDDDSAMWDLEAYEYSHNFFASDPYGDNMIYMNKFNPQQGTWLPISECPFAFYDTDGDRQSEVVVRVSAAPLAFDNSIDPDYANDAARYQGPYRPEMQHMGISNIRYSFDIDQLSGRQFPLHYECGFNLVGATPYEFPGMRHYNPRRRPPQVTCVIPWNRMRAIADTFDARETGLSWHEQHDDTIAIGDPAGAADLDYRWEGVFWIWERRFMENTGGPNQRWNVRREWSRKPSRARELYYSPVDCRLHLYGAEEGWIPIGYFAGLGYIGEVRMFDTNSNGFFDRWEVYLGDSPVPARVSFIRDDVQPRMQFDYEKMAKFETQKAIPDGMAANQELSALFMQIRPFTTPDGLTRAMSDGPPGFRRYAQDVALELQYADLRQHLTEKANRILRDAPLNDLRTQNAQQRATTANTQTAWEVIRLLEQIESGFSAGNAKQVRAALEQLTKLKDLLE